MNRRIVMRATLAIGVALCGGAAGIAAAGEDLMAGADARIEKHRKGDTQIRVVDAAGKAVPGAKVRVEQTRHRFLFGCNIFFWSAGDEKWRRGGDPELQAAYRKRFAELLNYATLPFYWWSYEPERGKPGHEYTGQVARWCREHGITCKGHPLAWNHNDAAWWPEDRDQLFRLQIERIDDCVRRFQGQIDIWDVVNEATHFDRPEFLKRAPRHTGMWKQVGQYEFTRQCFLAARKANPKATLLINDYRTDPPYEKVIEELVGPDGKRLYDVIGIQSHMHGGTWPNEKLWEVCERFKRFGVPLHFTETTILSGKRGWEGPKGEEWVSTPEGEEWQAHEVVRFYTMLFSHPAVEGITWWDFADWYSWKQAPAGFLRRDMSPKPSYDELMKLIKGKWWTKTSLTTAPDGKAAFRGFLGEYRVTVAVDGKTTTGDFTLKPGDENSWQIVAKR
jgi:GH35 family endo-1,4-beta-xylanase